jgi:dipeptidyl aminopeptidase/acylaminoacyl peptidase
MRLVLVSVIVGLLFQLHTVAQTANVELVRVPSGDAVMFGSMFTGDGSGPRPTVILLPGAPGGPVFGVNGQLSNVLGLAQPMQRAGFNVLAINYRGSWGSGGRHSVMARIEDAKAAMTFARSQAAIYDVDTAHLIVVGWSAGGFTALVASVEDPRFACTVAIAPGNYGARATERIRQETAEPADFDEATAGLGGSTPRERRGEILANQPRLDVARRMDRLEGRPLLIVQGKQDQSVPADDIKPYVDAARSVGLAPFDHVLIDANHNYTLDGNRNELASAVVNWITKHCK